MILKGLLPLLSKTTTNSINLSQVRTRLITARFLKAEEGFALSENEKLLFDTLSMAQKKKKVVLLCRIMEVLLL